MEANVSKLLFLSAHLPSPQALEAGQKTAFRNLELLAQRYDIHLVTFRNKLEREYDLSPLKKHCSEIEIIDVNTRSRIINVIKGHRYPAIVAARYESEVEQRLARLVRLNNFKRVHCEYSQMAAYCNVISDIPIRTISLHDVLIQWSYRKVQHNNNPIMKSFYKIEDYIVKQWECKAYSNFTAIYVPSIKDALLLKSINTNLHDIIHVIPLCFTIPNDTNRHDKDVEDGSIIFWGAMNRKENEEAAIWFIRKIFSRIKHEFPYARFYIMGNAPSRKLLEHSGGDIIVTGFVSEPQEYFKKAQIAVVPLLSGAGVKIKTLECMAAGLPVVATEIGSEGIDAVDHDGLLTVQSGDDKAFYNVVYKLMSQPQKCRLLGERASAWIRSSYNVIPNIIFEAEDISDKA
jgi:glycosyltransferase involved in cell wall biosynthesis